MTTSHESAWPVRLFCWAPAEVTVHDNRNVLITTSPIAFAMFYGLRTAGNRYMKKKAVRQAQPAWRDLGPGQLFVDGGGVQLSGSWGNDRLAYDEIMSWSCPGEHLILHPLDPDREPLAVQSGDLAALTQTFQSLSTGRLWAPPPVEEPRLRGDERYAGWEQRDPRFVFALPEGGWHAMTDPDRFNEHAQHAATHGERFLMMVGCGYQNGVAIVTVDELVDGDALQQVNADRQYYIRGAKALLRSRVDSPGDILGPPRTVSIAGEPGALMSYRQTEAGGIVSRVDEVRVGHGPLWLVVTSTFGTRGDPTPLWQGMPNDFGEILAAWRWRF